VILGGGASDDAQDFLVPLIGHDSGDAGLTPRSKRALAVLVGTERRRVGHGKLDGLVLAVHAVVRAPRWSKRGLSGERDVCRAVDGRDVERLLRLAHLARVKVSCVACR